MDLEGQLSNPDQPLRTLTPQRLSATSAARPAPRTRQKGPRARRGTRPSDELGHYSNPAPTSTGEQPSGRGGRTPPPTVRQRTQRRLRDVDVDALVDHYRAGDTIMQIAEGLSISRTTVMAHLNRRNVQRRAAAKEWDDDTLSHAARSYANGNSLAHIARSSASTHRPSPTASAELAVPIRPRRGWR